MLVEQNNMALKVADRAYVLELGKVAGMAPAKASPRR